MRLLCSPDAMEQDGQLASDASVCVSSGLGFTRRTILGLLGSPKL
jgi:hypothetical protein